MVGDGQEKIIEACSIAHDAAINVNELIKYCNAGFSLGGVVGGPNTWQSRLHTGWAIAQSEGILIVEFIDNVKFFYTAIAGGAGVESVRVRGRGGQF